MATKTTCPDEARQSLSGSNPDSGIGEIMIRHKLEDGCDYLLRYTTPGGFIRTVITRYHGTGEGGFEVIETKFIRTKKAEIDDAAEWVKINIDNLFDQSKNTGD